MRRVTIAVAADLSALPVTIRKRVLREFSRHRRR
jgi:hypothetical protein